MLQAQYRKTVDLDPLKDNPRTIKEKGFQEICDSIQKNKLYFEARPIILSNRTGFPVVIAGNMRLRAAVHIGMAEVPTVLIPGLTEDQEREIIIRDNINNGDWDWDLLANQWEQEQLSGWGLDLPDFDIDPDEQVDPPEKPADARLIVRCQAESDLSDLFAELQKRGFECELKQ